MKDVEKNSKNFPFFHPYSRRFHLMITLTLLYFSTNYMRTNLGMTMACMVNSTAVKLAASDPSNSSSSSSSSVQQSAKLSCRSTGTGSANDQILVNDYGGTLDWSSQTQSWLFTASFLGSMIATLPGGFLLFVISPKLLLGLCAFIVIISTAILPYLALYTSHHYVFASRFLLGVGIGPIVPAIDTLIARWIPSVEKGLAVSIYTTGVQIAGFIGVPFTAALCASSLKWPSVYYIAAVFALFMLLIYFLSVTNSPMKAKWMTDGEKEFLEQELGDQVSSKKKYGKIPWFSILTSLQVLSCYACFFAYDMGQAFLQYYEPIFFKDFLFLPIYQNGLYCAITNMVMFGFKLGWSILMLKLNEKYFTTTFSAKMSQAVSFVSTTLSFVFLANLTSCSQPWIGLLLFCGIAVGQGAGMNGFYTSMISLGPAYTGIISTGGRMCAMLSQFLTPLMVSFFRNEGSPNEWQTVYYVMASISLFSGIMFMIFGRCDIQEWAIQNQNNNNNQVQPKISVISHMDKSWDENSTSESSASTDENSSNKKEVC